MNIEQKKISTLYQTKHYATDLMKLAIVIRMNDKNPSGQCWTIQPNYDRPKNTER